MTGKCPHAEPATMERGGKRKRRPRFGYIGAKTFWVARKLYSTAERSGGFIRSNIRHRNLITHPPHVLNKAKAGSPLRSAPALHN